MIFIGVGSNINPEESILKALDLLGQKCRIEGSSDFFWTKAEGGLDQPDYLNGVWAVAESELPPHEFKTEVLKNIEKALGREEKVDKMASRPIDLDLLLYNDRIMRDNTVNIPDKDIYTRFYLLYPLYQLQPEGKMPDSAMRFDELLKQRGWLKIPQNVRPDQKITSEIKRRINNE